MEVSMQKYEGQLATIYYLALFRLKSRLSRYPAQLMAATLTIVVCLLLPNCAFGQMRTQGGFAALRRTIRQWPGGYGLTESAPKCWY